MMITLNLRLWLAAVVCLLVAGFAPTQAKAQVTYPPRIGEREFVADLADLIKPEDEAKIKATADKLLTDQGIPLQVVTINSMSDYGARGWSIERYAMNLFDEWQVGHQDRNTGILLLVSKNDRKVRIEMGAMFTHERDVAAADIINKTIVPAFKRGQFSEGITAGVQAIATQIGGGGAVHPPEAGGGIPLKHSAQAPPVSGGSSPTSTVSGSGFSKLFGPMACLVVPLIIIVVLSLLFKAGRRMLGGGRGMQPSGGYGPTGWGGGWGNRGGSGMGGTLGGLALGGLLGHMWGSRSHGSSSSSSSNSGMFGGGGSSGGGGGFSSGGGGFGGGFSGGSFGGGFSGGGGATGSW